MTSSLSLAQSLAAERAFDFEAAATLRRLTRLVRLSRRASRASQPVADVTTNR